MATWMIESESKAETRHVANLGRDEYDRRKAVAKAKTEVLEDWREQMFMAVQFENLAMSCSPENFAKLESLDGNKWARLIYKLATK